MQEFNDETKYITSVARFLDIKAGNILTSNINPGKWMYRGLKNYNYQLKPSVGRLYGEEPFIAKERLFSFEKSAFNEFRTLVYSELRATNQYILLAVAQHHGLKTRLLDWTFSPLVALFFAVEDTACKEDGALVVYQTEFEFNDMPNDVKSPFDDQLNEYHFLYAPDLSPRIKAQHGVFQMFKDPTTEFKEAYNLGKFRIPAENKSKIKKELEVLGVSYKTIFPDLDGLCKTINYNKLCLRDES